jgi:hypothetical protein
MEWKMKSKMFLTTLGAACISVLLVGCYGDKEEASTPSSATPETGMSGAMMDDMKEYAGSVVDSVEGMAGDTMSDAVDSVNGMTADSINSGQAAVDDAVKGVQGSMSASDADMDVESEVDGIKADLGAQMNKLP